MLPKWPGWRFCARRSVCNRRKRRRDRKSAYTPTVLGRLLGKADVWQHQSQELQAAYRSYIQVSQGVCVVVVGVFIYYFHTLYGIKLRSTAFPSSQSHTDTCTTQLTRPYRLILRYTSNRIITQNFHRRSTVRNQLLLLLFCTTAQAYIIDCNVISFRRQNSH